MTERHFCVVQLDGKKVEFGGVSITSKASPGSAARKLLTSIAHEKGLKKNKKASMAKVKFCIQEYTQGSSKKVYGPYLGHFHKYTAAELKKAKTAGGKIKFTMKPVVKLAKKNMKGGESENDNNFRKFIEDYFLEYIIGNCMEQSMSLQKSNANQLKKEFKQMLNLFKDRVNVDDFEQKMRIIFSNNSYQIDINNIILYLRNPNNNTKILIKEEDKNIMAEMIKNELNDRKSMFEKLYSSEDKQVYNDLVESFNTWVNKSRLNESYKCDKFNIPNKESI